MLADTAPKIDIVIPVYNEGDNIIAVLETFKSNIKTPFRVIICYDHEEDSTLKALSSYPGRNSINIMTVKKSGKGAHGAVLTGFSSSTAEAVIPFPADDTHNAEIIDEMYKKFTEGCALVSASRFIPGGCMIGAPFLKGLFVSVSSFTLCHLARVPAHDASNGFRLFSKRLIETIKIESEHGFVYSIELLVKCHRMGWKIGEVPAKWYERVSGKSRFKLLKWLPSYLKWYFYAYSTTYFFRKKI